MVRAVKLNLWYVTPGWIYFVFGVVDTSRRIDCKSVLVILQPQLRKRVKITYIALPVNKHWTGVFGLAFHFKKFKLIYIEYFFAHLQFPQ